MYQILYTPELSKKYPAKIKTKKYGKRIAVCLICLLFAASILFTVSNEHAVPVFSDNHSGQNLLFQTFLEELRQGTPFLEALTTFCRNVLQNGQ